MKKNKSEAVYESKQIALALVSPETVNDQNNRIYKMTHEQYLKELNEYDEGIAECHDMFLYYKEMGNEEEMASWRKMEQEAKTAKRLMMKKYNSKEEAAA